MREGLDYKLLMADAYRLASLSPDPSTQIGAFIINSGQQEWLTRTWNQPSKGWNMVESDWERPQKYAIMEHAERNAIYSASLYGICTAGATLVSSWAGCADCCRAMVQSGISKLVRHYPPLDDATERWLESISVGDRILKAGEVEIIDIIGPIPGAPSILRGGVLWDPSV